MGFEARIWALTLGLGPLASRLGFGPRGGGTEKEEEEEEKEKKEKEKFLLCESIGHWPLWGRCPKSAVMIVESSDRVCGLNKI